MAAQPPFVVLTEVPDPLEERARRVSPLAAGHQRGSASHQGSELRGRPARGESARRAAISEACPWLLVAGQELVRQRKGMSRSPAS